MDSVDYGTDFADVVSSGECEEYEGLKAGSREYAQEELGFASANYEGDWVYPLRNVKLTRPVVTVRCTADGDRVEVGTYGTLGDVLLENSPIRTHLVSHVELDEGDNGQLYFRTPGYGQSDYLECDYYELANGVHKDEFLAELGNYDFFDVRGCGMSKMIEWGLIEPITTEPVFDAIANYHRGSGEKTVTI